jgi:hypothetical protein
MQPLLELVDVLNCVELLYQERQNTALSWLIAEDESIMVSSPTTPHFVFLTYLAGSSARPSRFRSRFSERS